MSKTAQLDSVAAPTERADYSARASSERPSSLVVATMEHWWVYLIPVALALTAYAVVPYDGWLAHPDRFASLPGDLIRIAELSELFAHGFGVVVVAVGVYLLAPKSRVTIPRFVACAFWPGIVAQVLKFQFARIRPILYFDAQSQVNFPSDLTSTWLGWFYNSKLNTIYVQQSFPSAHTATVWGLAIGLSCVFPRGKYLFVFVAALASLQRVVGYAHWPSDVLAGAAVGILCAGALQQNWGLGWLLGRLEAKLSGKNGVTSTQ